MENDITTEVEKLEKEEKELRNEIFELRVGIATEPEMAKNKLDNLKKIEELTKKWAKVKLKIAENKFKNEERGKKL